MSRAPVAFVVERRPNQIRLMVSGDIDLATSRILLAEARSLLDDAAHLLLDFAGVTFFDSTGVHALLKLQVSAAEAGCLLAITNPSGITARVLELTGICQIIPVDFPDGCPPPRD